MRRELEDHFETRALGEVFNAQIDIIFGCHDVIS